MSTSDKGGSFTSATPHAPDTRLWYRQPAREWTEALPVGNGRLGAMVFGGVETEHLQLNTDTLWSGFPGDVSPQPGPDVLAEIRRLVMKERRYVAAGELTKCFQGAFNESFLSLGDLFIHLTHQGAIADYRRELDLCTALGRVTYTAGGLPFTREVFCSDA